MPRLRDKKIRGKIWFKDSESYKNVHFAISRLQSSWTSQLECCLWWCGHWTRKTPACVQICKDIGNTARSKIKKLLFLIKLRKLKAKWNLQQWNNHFSLTHTHTHTLQFFFFFSAAATAADWGLLSTSASCSGVLGLIALGEMLPGTCSFIKNAIHRAQREGLH